MKKILYFIPALKTGGIETLLYSWILNLPEEFETDIVVMGDIDSVQAAKFKKLRCTIYHLNLRQREIVKRIRLINGILKENNYNIVHVNTNTSFDVLPIILACKSKVEKRIFHSHAINSYDSHIKKLYDFICKLFIKKFSTSLVACSKEAGSSMFGKSNRIKIINNGIDVQRYMYNSIVRQEYREKFGFNNGDIVIGQVGRLCKIKNQIFSLKLIQNIPNANVKLIIVGSGPDYESLQEYIQMNNLCDRILMIGYCDDINNIYQALDIFILPSLLEGFGITLIEAQASGLQCIVSNSIVDSAILSDRVYKVDLNLDKWVNILEDIITKNIDRDNSFELIYKNHLDNEFMMKQLETIYNE